MRGQMNELAVRARTEVLTKAVVLRGRMRTVIGGRVCALVGHDWSSLKYDEGVGYYQSCGRCDAGDLLAPHSAR